jgi:hypothetical protein
MDCRPFFVTCYFEKKITIPPKKMVTNVIFFVNIYYKVENRAELLIFLQR